MTVPAPTVEPDTNGPTPDADIRDDDHETRRIEVDTAWHGRRLDHALVAMAPEFSRSHLQHLVELGHVRLDGVPVIVASRRLRLTRRALLSRRKRRISPMIMGTP